MIIRVLIRDVPKILLDILERVVSAESDMKLVSEPEGQRRVVTEYLPAPDVVIVGENTSTQDNVAGALLERWPRTHILMVMERGHRVVLHEWLPRSIELGELSPTQLVQAIRTASHSEDTNDTLTFGADEA